jgi:hypothetical protein
MTCTDRDLRKRGWKDGRWRTGTGSCPVLLLLLPILKILVSFLKSINYFSGKYGSKVW